MNSFESEINVFMVKDGIILEMKNLNLLRRVIYEKHLVNIFLYSVPGPTMTMRRPIIQKMYAEKIDAFYQ